MRKNIGLIITIMLTGGGILSAENSDILRIREHYHKTRNLIKSNALYHDQFVINKNNATWPAVGSYQEIYDIYYSLCDERETHNYPYERCVYMIEITTTSSASTSKTEYLFDEKDRLIFIYYKDGYKGTEDRYYLSEGKPVRYSKNNAVHDKQIESHINKSIFENLTRNAFRWANFVKKR